MNESIQIIRFDIDGRWTAEDMARSFSHLQELYNLRLVLQVMYEDWRDIRRFYDELMETPPLRRDHWRRLVAAGVLPKPATASLSLEQQDLAQVAKLLYPNEQLFVRRIKYGSEGFKDLAGIGEIVGHIKDFILRIIELRVGSTQRQLENEERALKNQQLRIENAERFVKLAKECGHSKVEIRRMVGLVDERQQTFIDLVNDGKIRGARLLLDSRREQQREEALKADEWPL